MRWWKVVSIWTVFALLATVAVLLERGAPDLHQGGGAAPPVGPSLLEADAVSVTALTLHQEGQVVRLRRRGGVWETLEPAGVRVSPDLVDATVATLTTGQAAERLDSEAEHDLAAYGLDVPTATLDVAIDSPSTSSITVMLGARNPTRTAIYARRSDRAAIYLVDMNLRYYMDLILEAAGSA